MRESMNESLVRVAALLSLVLLLSVDCRAQQPEKLLDGAHLHLNGTLVMERRGNRSFLMIRTGQEYMAVFDASDTQKVSQIGVTLDGQYESLKKLVGQRVTVDGKLQLEPVSPYYFNGVLLNADSIKPPAGPVLLPKKATAAALPPELKEYSATVIFSAKESSFSYKAQNADGTPLTPSWQYLSCGLNGPGDVMNCYCAAKFKPVETGQLKGKVFIPEDAIVDDYFAQFAIPEQVSRSVSRTVKCVRKTE